jgi:hypothetical protein
LEIDTVWLLRNMLHPAGMIRVTEKDEKTERRMRIGELVTLNFEWRLSISTTSKERLQRT